MMCIFYVFYVHTMWPNTPTKKKKTHNTTVKESLKGAAESTTRKTKNNFSKVQDNGEKETTIKNKNTQQPKFYDFEKKKNIPIDVFLYV